MDYKSMIGEKVVFRDGSSGEIMDVNSEGYIDIRKDGDRIPGWFMFDPFIGGIVKFADEEKQRVIDEKIEAINNEEKKIVEKYKTDSPEKETFYITLAKDETPHHENGLPDKVIGLSCSREDAFRAFEYYIKQEAKNISKPGGVFHQVGLYDAKENVKIAQET